MANIKSQIKRIRTNEKRRLRNQAVKSELKTLVRRTREAVEAGDQEKAVAALRVASRKLDVAVSKGVIHKNQAANRKSKLAGAARSRARQSIAHHSTTRRRDRGGAHRQTCPHRHALTRQRTPSITSARCRHPRAL